MRLVRALILMCSVQKVLGRCLVLALLLGPESGRADAPRALYAVYPAEARARPESARLVARLAKDTARTLQPISAPPRYEDDAADRSELSLLTEVERALIEARELSADLREAAALRVLSGAEQALLGALALPGVHAFLAEVYLQLALCAAQLNEDGLFESALERALSLDPSRRLEAAEAPPAILERARALGRSHDLAAFSEGQIEVHAEGLHAPAASAWLDGVRASGSELAFRARAGVHILVVRAPGHAPYATLLRLMPGKRPALRVALSQTAEAAAKEALSEAGPALRPTRARTLARTSGADVYVLEIGSGTRERALVQHCTAASCTAPTGLDLRAPEPARFDALHAHEPPSFANARTATAWLNDAPSAGQNAAHDKPVWKRWPLWAGSAALVLTTVVITALLTRVPDKEQQRSLEIDASALPR